MPVSSFEHLDMVLGEALENIVEAAQEVRGIAAIDQEKALRCIGRATTELWDVRSLIYGQRPDLEHALSAETREDAPRCEALTELFHRAAEAEESGNLALAQSLYTELLGVSRFGHYQRVAQAGLYRIGGGLRGSDPQ